MLETILIGLVVLIIILFILGIGKIFFPFTDKPEDFRIRIEYSWFSQDYIHYKYSGNGGISWKYISCAEPPFLYEENWKWIRLSHRFNPNSSNFDYELNEKFSSIQKIKEFEEKEFALYNKGYNDSIKEWEEYKNKKIQAFNKINKN